MSTIAIIPARGGSKRIPRKNIKPFHGRPMIAYSIEAALGSGLFDRVIVSTEDPEIAEVAIELGADVPFLRPANLADDYTGTNEVTKHVICALNELGDQVEYACCLYATAPFVQARYLRAGRESLLAHPDKSYAFSVTTFDFPIQRALYLDQDGAICAREPQFEDVRSQDLKTVFYHDAGQFYWGRAAAWLRGGALFAPSSLPVVLPSWLVQDIDTEEDWRRAELMYASLHATGELG